MKTPRISIHLPLLLSCVFLSASGQSRGAVQPAARYAGVTVLAQEEVATPGQETVRTTLARAQDFKYPILRIVEKVVAGQVVDQSVTVGDHIIVKLEKGKTQADLVALNAQLGGTIRKALRIRGVYLVAFKNAALATVPNGVATYAASQIVEYAEPDCIMHTQSTIPNDSRFSDLWGLHNTGQTGGTADMDIDAPEAWDSSLGTGVVVAVIDSGIDYNHEDLTSNMWVNSSENPTNGVDDDGNGYVDDVYGIDRYNNDSDPMDDYFHGTHCAGIVAAVGNNNTGVVGVAWQAKLMALKFMDSAGKGSASDAAECLQYVIDMVQTGVNVRVTSNSYGGSDYSQTLRNAIIAAASDGVLFVAAAGNDMKDLDDWGHNVYPGCYTENSVIAVASMDQNGNMSSFSNYGLTRIDLSAPGSGIWSTMPGNNYASKSGTSMATPHVAGVAALLFSHDPSVSMLRVRELLLEGVTPLSVPIAGRTVTDGCVNAEKSLALLDAVATPSFEPPAGVYDTNAVQVTITCQTSGATVYFTTNGVDPDQTSTAYSTPISVAFGATLKARAYLAGSPESPVKTGEYLWPRLRTEYWSMDAYPGWTEEGLWQFGVPLGGGDPWYDDPTSGATGEFVYGYNLAGNYEVNITRSLTTQAIDCSDLRHTELHFRRWLCLGQGQSSIEISTNGTTWVDVWRVHRTVFPEVAVGDQSWKTRTYDISTVADGQPTVYLRWVMGPTTSYPYTKAGWNIDDIEIRGSTAPAAARWTF